MSRPRMDLEEKEWIALKMDWFFSIPHFKSGIHHFTPLKRRFHFRNWGCTARVTFYIHKNSSPILEVNSSLYTSKVIDSRNWRWIPQIHTSKVSNWLPELEMNSDLIQKVTPASYLNSRSEFLPLEVLWTKAWQ